jgi:predicted CoA-binding protein
MDLYYLVNKDYTIITIEPKYFNIDIIEKEIYCSIVTKQLIFKLTVS